MRVYIESRRTNRIKDQRINPREGDEVDPSLEKWDIRMMEMVVRKKRPGEEE
jgi:hypothetical protein